MSKNNIPDKGALYRSFQLRADDVIEDDRRVRLSFSSEEPVLRYYRDGFVWEVLDHSADGVDLSRLDRKAPFLRDHDPGLHVGVVEVAAIDESGKGLAEVRLGKGALASDTLQDMRDGIRPNISVGYEVLGGREDGERDGYPVWRFKWRPFELSSVAIPADTSVGVGRAFEGIVEIKETPAPEEQAVESVERSIAPTTEETKTMEEKVETRVETPSVADESRQLKNEQRRTNEILAMAEKHDAIGMAREFITAGKSVEDFACALLERAGARRVEVDPAIGMSEKDTRKFSLVRAINALANPHDRQAQEAAGFERECSEAAAKHTKREAQGFLVPHDVLMRDLTVGTSADGGYLKGTDHLAGSFIDALRNRMMVRKMGARVLDGLVGDVAIPKLSAGATSYWVDGDTTTGPTESKQTFGQVALAPKTVGALTDISRKLLKQSSPSVDMLVQDDLSTILALAIDAAALHGVGSSNQPTGVASTVGIGSVAGGANGAAPTWGNMLSLWSEVAVDNADIGSLGFLTNAKVIGKLMATDKGTDTGKFVIEAFPNPEGYTNIGGMRCGVSNQVSSTLTKGTTSNVCSAIFFGNWADLLIGAWGGLDLTVDPYTGSSSGTVRVVALQDVDVAVRHAQSFSAMLDAVTT